MLFAIILFIFVPNTAEQASYLSEEQKEELRKILADQEIDADPPILPVAAIEPLEPAGNALSIGVRSVFRSPILYSLAIGYFAITMLAASLSTYLPKILQV